MWLKRCMSNLMASTFLELNGSKSFTSNYAAFHLLKMSVQSSGAISRLWFQQQHWNFYSYLPFSINKKILATCFSFLKYLLGIPLSHTNLYELVKLKDVYTYIKGSNFLDKLCYFVFVVKAVMDIVMQSYLTVKKHFIVIG